MSRLGGWLRSFFMVPSEMAPSEDVTNKCSDQLDYYDDIEPLVKGLLLRLGAEWVAELKRDPALAKTLNDQSDGVTKLALAIDERHRQKMGARDAANH